MPPLLLYFCIMFPATLVLEGLVLLAFKISLAKNWIPLLLVNLVAQTALTFTAGLALARSGPAAAVVALIPAGFVIMIVEALVYEHFFKTPKPKTALAFGIVANLTSWTASGAAIGAGWLQNFI